MVKEEKLAPLAAEGFAAITGLRIEKEFAQAPKRWNPDDEESEEEEEEYGPEADLPKPKPDAIVHWWKEAKPKFDPAQRWLRGHLWSIERLLLELKEGPARRREALSLDLAIRTRSQVLVAWCGYEGLAALLYYINKMIIGKKPGA